MRRILITGGAGFIGSHLCRRFLDDGAVLLGALPRVDGSQHFSVEP